MLPARRFDWRPSIEPVETIRGLNAWLATYAQREKLTFVDYYSAMRTDDQTLRAELSADGVHPNKAGYGIMRGIVDRCCAFSIRADALGNVRHPIVCGW